MNSHEHCSEPNPSQPDRPNQEFDFFTKNVDKLIANGWTEPSAINVMKSISMWTQPEQDRIVEVWAEEGETYVFGDIPVEDSGSNLSTDDTDTANQEYHTTPDGIDTEILEFEQSDRITRSREFQAYLNNESFTRNATPPETPQ